MMDTHTARAHRRTLAAVVVAALGATTLAACGGDAGASEAGESPTITQFYHQYGEEGVQEAVTAWPADNGSENVDVQWVTGDYGKRITALLLAGAGIDLFENNVIDVASAREGKYADLTALVEPIADQFNPTALKAVTIDGKYYGVPMIADSQLLLYRPSMFEDAGVEVPTTWEEFVEVTRALTTDDHKGLFLGNDGGAAVIASNGAAAAGTGVMNDDQTEITFDSEGLAGAFTDLHQLYDEGSLLTGAPTDWWDPASFIAGDAAIAWTGMWSVPAILDALGDDVGAFALPAIGSEGEPMVSISLWTMQVAGSSENIPAATDLVEQQWIEDTTFQQSFAVDFGFHIPPLTATMDETEVLQSGLPQEITALTLEHGFHPGPFWTPTMSTALTDAAARVILEGADATSELATAQATAQSALDALNP